MVVPENNKTPLTIGLLAHVDAGKTTLSEALLYVSGAKRTLGRVDHRDAYLDTHDLERSRGITIFSKQALLETPSRHITLVDTPGHVDFSAEAERVMSILDCAVLVISSTDGIQAHTLTLWRLLERYHVPTFLFINKTDLPGCSRDALMVQLQKQLGSGCIDFGMGAAEIAEAAAMCDEALLDNYLETGEISAANLRGLIESRKVFPCFLGSALKLTGVDDLLQALDTYGPRREYAPEFGAQVYKISRDPQGTRLTWMKLTGGSIKVRSTLSYESRKKEPCEEKIIQLRRYSGEKFTALESACAGELVAVTGLSNTYIGQAFGTVTPSLLPVLNPVMTYRVRLPKGADTAIAWTKLKQLEEEDPLLHLIQENGQIHVQIMGKVQLEVFRSLVQQRFGLDILLEDQRIFYKETISNKVEGVGHFEPLRHYAECHLLLEPLPTGSGLVFDSVCSTDVLDLPYQKLIISHLGEKTHRGVLTGAPITDMKITLLVGKAHLKHTEGGDFRQATYRAVRQGLMQAKSVLLEPWYDFILTCPTDQIGRAITDIRAMGGNFDAPDATDGISTLRGAVPAAEVKDYTETVAAYTQGKGKLQLSLRGYEPCHNQNEIVAEIGYNPEADLENTPDSVFCAHGAGFNVKWSEVKNYMHLESGLKEEKSPQIITRHLSRADELELERIMEREFGSIKRPLYPVKAENIPATEEVSIHPPKQKYVIVDGYNIIFAWSDLAEIAKSDIEAARRKLCDQLSSYAGFTKTRMVVVFDGYKQKGNPGEKYQLHNIQVVYTKEGETADAYIEALASQIGSNYLVRVATSDSLVQISSLRSGVLRMSARELMEEIDTAQKAMMAHFQK